MFARTFRLRQFLPQRAPNERPFGARFHDYWYGTCREARGLKLLLREWPSPEQLVQFEKNNYFDVTGCISGRRYLIRHGTAMNIHKIDRAGQPIVGWCFIPDVYLVAGDVMLAQ
jgi:hypothetical protein